jgi:hypothetical protein
MTGKSLRRASSKRYFVASRVESASETIGNLENGVAVTGLTCGQFSMVDIIEHCLKETGGGDLFVSTWTAGIYDIERSKSLMDLGLIKSVRFVLDRAMFSKSPQYAGPMIEAFGIDSFRDTNVHAKVSIITGAKFNCVIRASMNLNKNLKTEQFDIDCCNELHDFYMQWANLLWDEAKPNKSAESVFKSVWDKFTKLRGEPIKSAYPLASDIAKKIFNERNGLA